MGPCPRVPTDKRLIKNHHFPSLYEPSSAVFPRHAKQASVGCSNIISGGQQGLQDLLFVVILMGCTCDVFSINVIIISVNINHPAVVHQSCYFCMIATFCAF